ncbi:MAG: ArnT family glycosyltransferase, partial [Candidatus Binatia bacterium]
MTRSRWLGLLVGLFLAAFFTRAYHPISRPVQWMARARAFNRAFDARDWFGTYQSYHPGFTTMAIGGLALRLYDAAAGTPAAACFNWANFPFATPRGRRMAAGVMGLSLALAGLIIASVLVLRLLAGWRIALVAGGFMTFAPFTLAQSRRFHVDGLLSEFMLLSALLLLLGLQTRKRRYLLWSGFVGGLSLLTKTPAAFLVPFTALALLSYAAKELRACRLRQDEQRRGALLQRAW